MNEPKKSMYALVWTYLGADDNEACSAAIAVSDSVQRLEEEMTRCIEEDTVQIDEDDEDIEEGEEWSDDQNYIVLYRYEREARLQHRLRTDLEVVYKIQAVSVV